MSDKAKQQISNLMDGELELSASKFLLKRMAADKSLSQTWDSYHLIKSCLQKQSDEPLVIDIAARVTQQLQNETQPNTTTTAQNPTTKSHNWLKPVLGLGIAASVAFMSVFMLQNQTPNETLQNSSTQLAKNSNAIAQPFKPALSASYASSEKSLVPPPSLSRFPSVSAKNTLQYNQGFSQNIDTPYMIIINQKEGHKHNKSPIIIKNVSD